jgi:protein O-GlcNAc transferase
VAKPTLTIDQALRKAKTLSLQGKAGEAVALYQAVLKSQPLNAEALSGLKGLAGRAVQANAGSASREPSQESLQTIINLHGTGQFEEAARVAAELAAVFPQSPVVANIQGVLSLNLGRREAAADHFRKALDLKPDFIEVLANLGSLLTEMGHLPEAVSYLERAHAARPDAAEIITGLANAYAGLGMKEKAVESYRKAIRLNPSFPNAHSNLGNVLGDLGRFEEAVACLREAIQLKPDFADAYSNLGNVLKTAGRLEEAEPAYASALLLKPDFADGHANLAALLGDLGRTQEALVCYEKALALQPDNLAWRALALYQQALTCRWDLARENSLQRLQQADFSTMPGQSPSPFAVLTLIDDPLLQRRAAEAHFRKESAGIEAASLSGPPSADGRIRIGYFSADFHGHATMYLMARLFELHDRTKFEVHAFSFGPDEPDEMRARLVDNVEHFHDIRHLPHQEAAALSRKLGIDIAIDLKGYTRDARPQIFAHRAAPIQVGYLGYPGTCGSPLWDYFIADQVTVSKEVESGFSEKIVFMPSSYQVNDDRRVISERRFTRAECGLPEKGFVFACFNNSYKITPVEFDIWMRLLKQVDGSVLWLLKGTPETENNLRRETQARGVDPARLVFAPRVAVGDHLARHDLADLFVDTFIVNAHTTASDALWAGLPVVALAGNSFVARVSASLLHACGLDELVTGTAADYEALALSLARDPERLAMLKARLKSEPQRLPLFDTRRYVLDLERAYGEMLALHRSGEAPRNLHL